MMLGNLFEQVLKWDPFKRVQHNNPSSEIVLQLGEIQKVNIAKKTVTVQSYFDGSFIPDIPLDPPLYHKFIPVVGQQVLIMRSGNSTTRILSEFGTPKEAFVEPIQPGETMVKGIGHSYLFLDRMGNVMLSDKDVKDFIKIISRVGISVGGNSLSINIQGIGKLNILNDDDGERVELIKTKKSGKQVKPATKVTLKNDKIVISGATIEIGLESDSNKGGVVVSKSGIPGPFSNCFVTGAPIPCSAVTKSSILPSPPTT